MINLDEAAVLYFAMNDPQFDTDKVTCERCHDMVDESDTEIVDTIHGEQSWCSRCVNDDAHKCDWCGKLLSLDLDTLCEDCQD